MTTGDYILLFGWIIGIIFGASYIYEYATGKNELIEFLKDLKNIKEWLL